jgi:hypothetical protein
LELYNIMGSSFIENISTEENPGVEVTIDYLGATVFDISYKNLSQEDVGNIDADLRSAISLH